MAEITWTDEARRWLQEIYDYIAKDHPEAAYRIVTEIHEKAGLLAQFPQMGSRYRVTGTSGFLSADSIESHI